MNLITFLTLSLSDDSVKKVLRFKLKNIINYVDESCCVS